jgi:hypothetical protein
MEPNNEKDQLNKTMKHNNGTPTMKHNKERTMEIKNEKQQSNTTLEKWNTTMKTTMEHNNKKQL